MSDAENHKTNGEPQPRDTANNVASGNKPGEDARKARLSQALRDNLRRRKAQTRARKNLGSSAIQNSSGTKASDES